MDLTQIMDAQKSRGLAMDGKKSNSADQELCSCTNTDGGERGRA